VEKKDAEEESRNFRRQERIGHKPKKVDEPKCNPIELNLTSPFVESPFLVHRFTDDR